MTTRLEEGIARTVWGRVYEIGAFDGGTRVRAMLLPEDDGPPIRVQLRSPPPELLDVLTLGVRAACAPQDHQGQEGLERVAYGIHCVQRSRSKRQWEEVYATDAVSTEEDETEAGADETLVETAHLPCGAIRRRRTRADSREGTGAEPPNAPMVVVPLAPPPPSRPPEYPMAVVAPLRRPVATTLKGLQPVDGIRTLAVLARESDGAPIELRLQRAPRGLLATLVPGVRVLLSTVARESSTGKLVATHVARVEQTLPDGTTTLLWEVDPKIAAARLAAKRRTTRSPSG